MKITGYGIIEKENFQVLDYGAYRIKGKTFPDYLLSLNQWMEKIIRKFHPQVMAIEEPFISSNPRIAIRIGEMVGSLTITGLREGMEVITYSTLEVKQAVTGYGRASKEQMQSMVKRLLGLEEIPSPDDVADALGIAICHILTSNWKEKTGKVD